MKTSIKKIRDFLEEKGMLKHLGKAPVVIAAVVVAATVYALILPALTLEKETYCGHEAHVHSEDCYELVPVCGKEETDGGKVLSCSVVPHVHTDACRDADGNYICGYADYTIHKHDKYCYDEDGNLVCKFIEAEEHQHDASCYTEGRNLTCGQQESAGHTHSAACYTEHRELTCGQAESAGHTHTDACYDADGNLICGQEESAGHTHTDACYSVTQELTCGQAESAGHTHTDACYSITSTLTCGKEEIVEHEHTQECFAALDHEHTDACRNEKGYLVCGGLICGKTEVLKHQHTSDCWKMQEAHKHTDACMEKQLTCKLPEHEHTDICYDVDKAVAARQEADAERNFIATTEDDEDTDNIEGTGAEAVLPACGKEEHEHTALECYDADGNLTCEKEEHKHTDECYDTAKQIAEAKAGATLEKTYEDENVKVTAAYDESANIPEEAELIAEQITAESDPEHFAEREAQMREQLGNPDAPMSVLFKIGFYVNGEEIEPESDVIITIQLMEDGIAAGDPFTIVHFGDEGTETLSATDIAEDEDGNLTTSFRTKSFSEFAGSPIEEPGTDEGAGTPESTVKESSDLRDFLTPDGVTITDWQGNVVRPENGKLVVGDSYKIKFSFSEKYGDRQFKLNDKGELVYDIGSDLKCSDIGPITKTAVIAGKQYTYTYEVKDNQLIVRPDGDWYSEVNDATFEIELDADVVATGEDYKVDIPVADEGNLEFDIGNPEPPSIEKTAGKYDPSTQTVEYTIVIEAGGTDQKGLTFYDVLTDVDADRLLEYRSDDLELVVERHFTQDGKHYYTPYDIKELEERGCKVIVEKDYISIDPLPDLGKGERFEITYKAHLKDGVADKDGNLIESEDGNKVTVNKEGDANFPLEDDAKVKISSNLLKKTGKEHNPGEIRWTVTVGDGNADLKDGVTVRDTLGDGLEFEEEDIKVYVVDATNPDKKYQTSIKWEDVMLSGDHETMTYNLPSKEELEKAGITVPESYYFEVQYDTKYTADPGTVGTFSNTLSTTIEDKEVTTSGEASGIGPVGDITKENFGIQGNYLRYKIVHDHIPAVEGGTYFRIVDRLRFEDAGGEGVDYYVENVPHDLQVLLNGEKLSTTPLTEPNNYYTERDHTNHTSTEVYRFYLNFNTNIWDGDWDSKLYLDNDSKLEITYGISLDAPVYTDEDGKEPLMGEVDGEEKELTLRDILKQGYILNNDARVNTHGYNEATTENQYKDDTSTKPLQKNVVDNGDGTFTYTVQLDNWDEMKDNGHGSFEPLIKSPESLVFTDQFSEYLEFVPYKEGEKNSGLRVETQNRSSGKLYARYLYEGNPLKEENIIEAKAEGFSKRLDTEDPKGEWSQNPYYYGTLVEAMNHRLGKDGDSYYQPGQEGYKGYRIVFIYTLKLKEDFYKNATSSYATIANDVTIKADDKTHTGHRDFDYETKLMDKKGVFNSTNNTIDFTIELNEHGNKLLPEGVKETKLTLTDVMSENLKFLSSSLTVTANGKDITKDVTFTYDNTTNELVISGLPDESHLVIKYSVSVDVKQEDKNIDVTNKASINPATKVESNYEEKLQIVHSDSSATGSLEEFTLVKTDRETHAGLDGAEFAVYVIGKNGDPRGSDAPAERPQGVDDQYTVNATDGNKTGYYIGYFKTGGEAGKGRATIQSLHIANDFCYIIVEIKAPTGYKQPEGADVYKLIYYGEDKAKNPASDAYEWVNPDGVVEITNDSYGYELPETGGPGTTIFALAGITLLGVAGLMYRTELEKRRRRARSESRKNR